MQNKIELEVDTKVTIVEDVNGVDFDLRVGDVVSFKSFDAHDSPTDEWKKSLADELNIDISRLKGALLYVDSKNFTCQALGWFPIDVQTNTILSY
jgi:hypothetical protein